MARGVGGAAREEIGAAVCARRLERRGQRLHVPALGRVQPLLAQPGRHRPRAARAARAARLLALTLARLARARGARGGLSLRRPQRRLESLVPGVERERTLVRRGRARPVAHARERRGRAGVRLGPHRLQAHGSLRVAQRRRKVPSSRVRRGAIREQDLGRWGQGRRGARGRGGGGGGGVGLGLLRSLKMF
jgi:hypothetical protein